MQKVQYETIKTEIKDHILMITLSRENMNAFNRQMLSELLQVFDEADENDQIRVIIMTGDGKAFCAGADLGRGGETFENKETPVGEYRDGGGILSLRIFDLKKPIIAAINGAAVGVGATMTLPMDIRIASSKAKMGFVFSKRGITPEACSGWFLPRVVGISRATELVFTGKIIPAEEALNLGLVSQVVPPEELLATAEALAKDIADNTSATSVTLSRQLLWKMLGADHPKESHLIESKMIQWAGQQADAREGVHSFLEKRKPDFTMKPSKDLPDFYPWWE
ncbi:crotonase/enoyl-CoA hydratase family protein [Cytobacillus purgationiresistens]|uniref:Enoyl-CoA hydratase/carnithine racemase n=1 Tax=Cytobacillus purgationiresistens TaxID=863449 RepID=A0ABU0AGN0_9BACI|nr:crotonase/enoyl-CoA hydratase family protein [Cytobacillus purgationiresistens]MDQ0270404.1 enoyl-CoA hydratase/carnithine racemase [Cytobacillus purgationiresistens]